MPPQLMLMANGTLAIYLFYCISRDRKKVSGVSWVFAVWLMIVGSRSLGAWLFPHASYEIVTGTEGSRINTIAGMVFGAVGFYTISRRRVDIAGIVRQNAVLFALLGYGLVSCVWSNEAVVSFRRWFRMILEVVVVIAILSEPDRKSTTSTLIERYAIFALPLSLVLIKYFPAMAVGWDATGDTMMWTGVSLHKNGLGVSLASCILYYTWKWLVRRDFRAVGSDALLLALASYMLFNPQVKGSSTAILSLIPGVALLCVFGLYRMRADRLRPVLYVAIASALLVSVGVRVLSGKGIVEFVTLLSGRDMTFTGRTIIWAAVREEAARSPIFGAGYQAFWVGDRLALLRGGRYLLGDIHQAHNGYLETYANLGLIGLTLLLVTLLGALVRGLRSLGHDYEHNSLLVAYVVFYMLAEFFEATALSAQSFRWTLLLLLAVRVPPRVSGKSGL